MTVHKQAWIPTSKGSVVIPFVYDPENDTYTVEFSGELLRNGSHEDLAEVFQWIPEFDWPDQ